MKKYLDPILILALVIISYSNSLWNNFVWDDLYTIVKDNAIKEWSGLPHLLTSGYWSTSLGRSLGLYRPLTNVTYLVEHSFAGLNPVLYHLDNVILHFICSLFVYLIARSIFKDGKTALFSALLFAAHPTHTESVAWVTGRAELLSVMFFLSAFYTFIRPPQILPWYILSPSLLFLGLLSKETAVTLPVFILVYVLFFERKERGGGIYKISITLLPYLISIFAYFIIRFFILGGDFTPASPDQVFAADGKYTVFLYMVKALFHYIRLVFLPFDLRAMYLYSPPEGLSTPLVAFMLISAVSFFALTPLLFRKNKPLLFFLAWFFIALIPVSNIIPIGILMSERALYLPSAAFCILTGLLLSTVFQRYSYFAVSCFALAVLSFGMLTAKRNEVWRDAGTFDAELASVVKRSAETMKPSSEMYRKLANIYMNYGHDSEAEWALERALDIGQGAYITHALLADYYDMHDKHNLAFRELKAALPYSNLFSYKEYSVLATVYLDANMDAEAEKFFKKAIELNSVEGLTYFNYSMLLSRKGDNEGALYNLKKAAELYDPVIEESYFRQGIILGNEHRYKEAADAFKVSLNANPRNPLAHLYLGASYANLGLMQQAMKETRDALALDPGLKDASDLYDNLTEAEREHTVGRLHE